MKNAFHPCMCVCKKIDWNLMERISINTENFVLILHNKSRAIFTLLNEWWEKNNYQILRNNFIDSRFLSCIREIIYRDPHLLSTNNLLARISKQRHLRWSFFKQCFILIFFYLFYLFATPRYQLRVSLLRKFYYSPSLFLYYCVVFSWKSSNSLIIRFP